MPQFLRCIRVLCSLYPFYKQAYLQYQRHGSNSLPKAKTTSPSSRVKRTDSLGSRLDDGRPHGIGSRSFLNSWTGHRRTSSHEMSAESFRGLEGGVSGVSASLGTLDTLEFPSDPLQQLEVIWLSLSSWFDLLMKEIQKLPEIEEEQEASLENVTFHKELSHEEDMTFKETIKERSVSPESAQLAAAIILSAPPKRRQVFLKPSVSFEGNSRISKKCLKRRSWHVECVARVIPLDEEYSSLPSFQRSKSSENSSNQETELKHGMTICHIQWIDGWMDGWMDGLVDG